MNSYQQTSVRRVIHIASPRAPQSHSVLALMKGHRAIDLAELAESIHADRNLCSRVTEAACQESGWPRLSVEDAIVLLGRERLCALLTSSHRATLNRQHSSARQLRSIRITPAANLFEIFRGEQTQEEPE